MGKRDEFIKQLQPLLLGTSADDIEEFLLSNSNLPGPRGNLELAYAFGDCYELMEVNSQWNMLQSWSHISADEAPVNSPGVFLPFCAIQALSSLYALVDPPRKEQVIEILKTSASDNRWRIREAVAMGFQRIAEKDWKVIDNLFTDWIKEASLLEKRAIIATLAHPPILGNQANVLFCFKISEKVLGDLLPVNKDVRRTDDFGVLKKGLEYAISVFVAHLPEQGFALLKKWALENDADIKRIVKSNLGKSRLTKKYSDQVKEVLALL